jgi:hypothetical protein
MLYLPSQQINNMHRLYVRHILHHLIISTISSHIVNSSVNTSVLGECMILRRARPFCSDYRCQNIRDRPAPKRSRVGLLLQLQSLN